MAVGQEAVVADAMEAVRQRVKQDPADELVCREGHELGAAVLAVILPAESELAGRERGVACRQEQPAQQAAEQAHHTRPHSAQASM
jgi:hypothetical protein